MLQRAYNRAKRDLVLNEAMELVLNLQPRREIVIQPKGTVTGRTAIGQQSMYQQQINAVVDEEFNKAFRNILSGTSP
jgi:diphthamide biosynthesis methyltransferase